MARRSKPARASKSTTDQYRRMHSQATASPRPPGPLCKHRRCSSSSSRSRATWLQAAVRLALARLLWSAKDRYDETSLGTISIVFSFLALAALGKGFGKSQFFFPPALEREPDEMQPSGGGDPITRMRMQRARHVLAYCLPLEFDTVRVLMHYVLCELTSAAVVVAMVKRLTRLGALARRPPHTDLLRCTVLGYYDRYICEWMVRCLAGELESLDEAREAMFWLANAFDIGVDDLLRIHSNLFLQPTSLFSCDALQWLLDLGASWHQLGTRNALCFLCLDDASVFLPQRLRDMMTRHLPPRGALTGILPKDLVDVISSYVPDTLAPFDPSRSVCSSIWTPATRRNRRSREHVDVRGVRANLLGFLCSLRWPPARLSVALKILPAEILQGPCHTNAALDPKIKRTLAYHRIMRRNRVS